jgi:Bacterial PH domain
MQRISHDPALERTALGPGRTLFLACSIYGMAGLIWVRGLASPTLVGVLALGGTVTLVNGLLGHRTHIGPEGVERLTLWGATTIKWSDVRRIETQQSTLVVVSRDDKRVHIPLHGFRAPDSVVDYVRVRVPTSTTWQA